MRFGVWKLVRLEIAFKGAPNVLQACAAIIARHRVIRILADRPGAAALEAIADPGTLRQWYLATEKARRTDSELEMLCAGWEASMQRIHSSMSAAEAVYRDAWLRGIAHGLPDELIAPGAERAAAATPHGPRSPMAAPRKNRRV